MAIRLLARMLLYAVIFACGVLGAGVALYGVTWMVQQFGDPVVGVGVVLGAALVALVIAGSRHAS